jgi:hypothetical protein
VIGVDFFSILDTTFVGERYAAGPQRWWFLEKEIRSDLTALAVALQPHSRIIALQPIQLTVTVDSSAVIGAAPRLSFPPRPTRSLTSDHDFDYEMGQRRELNTATSANLLASDSFLRRYTFIPATLIQCCIYYCLFHASWRSAFISNKNQ